MHKKPLGQFLAQNTFSCPRTLGFFYREKMRAIHRIAPDVLNGSKAGSVDTPRILEIGGGRSGLSATLYPQAEVINIDLDLSLGKAPCNLQPNVQFLSADATALPFSDNSFELVTMFDLLEHVHDDSRAVEEAIRVLRPGGQLLVSTPRENWRYPYYRFLRSVCPTEEELFSEWGHVRRGYAKGDLERLIPISNTGWSSFISPLTALSHDISFSNLPKLMRVALCASISPLTWFGYWRHGPDDDGLETASAWRKSKAI